MNGSVRKVVIVGGGTAGWMVALLLARLLGRSLTIELVESEQIGIVGVGEATIPPIRQFNRGVGIDEREFLRETRGSIKLGIQFENWGTLGSSYMHAFGAIGKNFPFCNFHHFWTRSRQEGLDSSYWDYSLNFQAARAGRFARLDKIEGTNLAGLVHAYHLDAGLYAKYLRGLSERTGVRRIEGIVARVDLDPGDGFIRALQMQDGSSVHGDLFVDCSGFRALLIEQTLNTGYEDWTCWLPCDRAMAVPCESVERITPYTRAIAHGAGWQWRIPLQHRIGNGLVYSSRHLSDDAAVALLLGNLDGKALAEPRQIPFRTGRRKLQWNRNCVSLGLASGFLEPLESTSIHLIQSGATRLAKMFPHAGINAVEVEEYNRQSRIEFEHIRDFLILHYHLNQRSDSQFWMECARMPIPDSLAHRIELFRRTGKVFCLKDELFTEIAWQQVMIGQGIMPEDYHPIANGIAREQLDELLTNLRTVIDGAVAKLPPHESYLES